MYDHRARAGQDLARHVEEEVVGAAPPPIARDLAGVAREGRRGVAQNT
jgi:hypothetical protein